MTTTTTKTIVVTCRFCSKKLAVTGVNSAGWDTWKRGGLIQQALPDLSVDDRETLISQTCAECWDSICGDED